MFANFGMGTLAAQRLAWSWTQQSSAIARYAFGNNAVHPGRRRPIAGNPFKVRHADGFCSGQTFLLVGKVKDRCGDAAARTSAAGVRWHKQSDDYQSPHDLLQSGAVTVRIRLRYGSGPVTEIRYALIRAYVPIQACQYPSDHAASVPMLAFLLRRLGQGLLVVAVMATLVFVGVYALGNAIDILISPEADQLEREQAIERLGLDRPLWV